MIISSVKIKGSEYILKEPIVINEDVSYSKGKQMFILTNNEFNLLILCRDKVKTKDAIQEELGLIIDSYLFEPDYILSQGAIKLKERIKRHLYG